MVEKDKPADVDPMASLAVLKNTTAERNQSIYLLLDLAFSKPICLVAKKTTQLYTSTYTDAWDVIEKEKERLPELTEKTLTFTNSFLRSSYPEVIKEAALFNLSTLRSQTVFRTADGKMFGWEGIMDRKGSCFGSCTHVWNYEQATPFLFNDLAKTMREVEFDMPLKRTDIWVLEPNSPLNLAGSGIDLAAADGQMGTIMKFYRDSQLSGDTKFLKKHWPKIKMVLGYAWITNGWDGDVDGSWKGYNTTPWT